MSKAFTKESDDAPEEPLLAPRATQLPLGVKNYITPEGAHRLTKELNTWLKLNVLVSRILPKEVIPEDRSF